MEQPNFNYIKEMSGGDVVFEKKIIEILKTEFPLEKETYLKFKELNQYKEIAEIVHKLKHKISILGLEKGYSCAVDYENNLRKERFKGEEEFEAVLQSMTDYIKTI